MSEITGHHEVKVFTFKGGTDEQHALPEGWKPYQSELVDGVLWVYASLWIRKPRTQEPQGNLTMRALATLEQEEQHVGIDR
jgi:hypothetical protein